MSKKQIVGVVAGVLAGAGVVFSILAFLWIWVAPCSLGGCAPLDDLATYQAEGSELLDVHGTPFARLATVNRTLISVDSLPPYVPQAFIAIEDRRFYSHGGLDFRRTAGALLQNLRSGQVEEGGSTITQQLARNLFPEWLPYRQRNVRRKILEARVARQMERGFSKDKILELYLNHIYLGSGAYGIEAAARTYFGKGAGELTLMEAATLAGLPQAPSQINPRESVERATRRRDLVLDQMVVAGFISTQEAAQASAEAIQVVEGAETPEGPEGSYFVERVRRELQEQVGSRFYTAGLKIHTTYDPLIQAAAEGELHRQLDAIESGRFGSYRHATYANYGGEGAAAYLQGAVVVLDAATGEVLALVGGRDFGDSKYDRVTQAVRQPGSAFKPFVFARALERYRSPLHQVEDAPLRIQLTGGQIWEPRNYTDQYDGTMTLREALARSKNTATVRLAQDLGIRSIVRLANDLGITTEIPEVPATALGAADVRPIDLVSAYAAFANGGERVEPHLIRRIVDRSGRVLWEPSTRRTRVLDPAVAFVLTSMLQDVVDAGTGSAVRAVGFRGPAAGKTGTTNDASDVWFIGYTPELVAGVWIGLDTPATIVRGASGGTLAAPVWGRLMQRIYASRPLPAGWRQPSGVVTAEADRSTGALVSEWCPAQGEAYTEFFIRSAPPPAICADQYRERFTGSDSMWVDEEWGELEPGMTGDYGLDMPGGVEWPELEALRRRVLRAQEDLARQQIGDGRTLPDTAGVGGMGEFPRPFPQPPGQDPQPSVDGDAAAAPEPPAQPAPAGERPPPRLLGEPVRPPTSPPAAP